MNDNYTKMMDAALKQGLIKWEPKVGDDTDKGIAWNFELDNAELGKRKPYGIYILKHDDPWARFSGEFYRLKEIIFKPSIKQLMEMVDEPLFVLGELFHQFVYKDYRPYCVNFDSSEELWLAFVMHELHNLKWSGKEWA